MITEPDPQYSKTSTSRRSNKTDFEYNGTSNVKHIVREILADNDYSNVTQSNAQDILNELTNIHDKLQSKSNYASANVINDAMTNIRNFINSSRFAKIQTKKFEEVETRLDTARSIRQSMQSDWKRLIQAAEEKRDQELNDMQQDFENDLAEFDKLYSAPPDIRFQKYSPELLNLRYRQKAMIQSNKFLEAKEIKQKADELENLEKEKNMNSWIDYLNKSRLDIIEKQKQQINHRNNIWTLEIDKMKRNAKVEIKHAKQQECHFSDRIERIQSVSELPEMQNTISPVATVSLRRAKSQRLDRTEKFERPLDDKQKTFRQRQIMNFIKYTKVTAPRSKK